MLRLSLPGGLALLLITMVGCAPEPEVAEPAVAVEASYRLTFNDTLVGNALFTLQIRPDGSYRIEAFTVPAGKMARANGHEVLETSEGLIDRQGIRPQRFEQRVMDGERVELVSLAFDWDKHALRLRHGDDQRDLTLLPQTHDRLSYLLIARHLAVAGEGSRQLQIASPTRTEETRLEVTGTQTITLPVGRRAAMQIRRVTPQADENRLMWFDPGFSALPLRMVHEAGENRVDMVLETHVVTGPAPAGPPLPNQPASG